ncbi:V-type proton ATPase subunit C 1-B isoform X4 [Scophthalmus maximus]|nr:V-type proton ATPase subunit C 1-B isoform X4 [Scophthalmus maximus]
MSVYEGCDGAFYRQIDGKRSGKWRPWRESESRPVTTGKLPHVTEGGLDELCDTVSVGQSQVSHSSASPLPGRYHQQVGIKVPPDPELLRETSRDTCGTVYIRPHLLTSYLRVCQEVSQVETELKCRAAAYNSVKTSLQTLEHKLSGNLQTRSLNDIVRKEDLVVSEYLTTLLVVVTRGSFLQWERTYESLSEFVVPRSSRKLHEDGEGGVFSVTLFKRAVCEFKAKAQESKFTVREYSFDLEEKTQQERQRLGVHKKEQYGIFVRWLKVNFNEVFVAWIHVKALRVFVESVLRYGLPVNYQALLLQTDRKCSKKHREELASLFTHLDPTATASKTDVSCDIPGLCQQEYFSYICFDINTNVLETS